MILIYNNQGKIIGSLSGMSSEEIVKNTPAGCFTIPGDISYIKTKYVKNGEFKDYPTKPAYPCIFNFTDEIWTLDLLTAIEEVKIARLSLLQNSDWTDTVSAQSRLSNYQQWQDYRQALRDITQQSGYPENVIWPTPPGE